MVLNKKGQTLILFIILIPLILSLMAFIVDLGLVVSSKSHLKEVTKTIIKENIDSKDEEIIKELMAKNDIDTSNLKIDINDEFLSIENEIEIDSIFGKIIGINSYKVKVKMRGYKNQDKLQIEY